MFFWQLLCGVFELPLLKNALKRHQLFSSSKIKKK
jgi:hypothetical protein